jgi:hypothetical protein
MSLTLETAARNAMADSFCTLLDKDTTDGTIEVAKSDNTVLATLTFADDAFAGSIAGVATANAIAPDTDAAATGTAAKMKLYDGAASPNLLATGTVTVTGGGGDLELSTTAIVQHAQVEISSMTVTCPAS